VEHLLVHLVDILYLQVNHENVLLKIIQAFHSVKWVEWLVIRYKKQENKLIRLFILFFFFSSGDDWPQVNVINMKKKHVNEQENKR
jgi:hypothetical protein